MELARLIDASPEGLSSRLAALTAGLTGPYVVSRHTYWFTNRPPVHEAVVHEPHAPSQEPHAPSHPARGRPPHPGSMAA